MKKIFGQPSWRVANKQTEAFVTETGGHVSPVKFKLGRRTIEPFSVAPWVTEKLDPKTPEIIKALRGDFFCMPFGGNAAAMGREKHPVHGEPANAKWKLESLGREADRTTLHLSLHTRIRRGRLDKRISLVEGHRAIYSQHVISGMTGSMCLGHHAMLKFPDEPGSGIISTSPFVFGQVFPGIFEQPEQRGYSILRPGAEFASLSGVPTITGQVADLSHYPARRGFEDLVMIASDTNVPFAWTAVVFPRQRYVWFALKNPNVLRSTVFWISNGGRHFAPWNGRHVNVMGLEEVTAYFAYGLAESVNDNPLSQRGIPTSIEMDPSRPNVVNYIMAVAEVPAGFDRVERIEQASSNAVELVSVSGKSISTPLDCAFLGSAAQ